MKTNKTLIYGVLGVVALGGLIYLLSTDKTEEEKKGADAEPKEGDEQSTPDAKVEKAKDASGKLTSLVGKDITTKVDKVNVRNTPEVNNGLINNIYGEIPTKDIIIGKVISVVKKGDKNWLGVKLSQKAYDIIQSQKNIVMRDIWTNIPPLKWVREDVIKLT